VIQEGKQSGSTEEIAARVSIIKELISGKVIWTDKHGKIKIIKDEDIKVIAPYNKQITTLHAVYRGS